MPVYINEVSESEWNSAAAATVMHLRVGNQPVIVHNSLQWHAIRFGRNCLSGTTREQLESRCIGASQAAAIVGWDKDCSPHKLFSEFVGLSPVAVSRFVQEAMQHGRDTESTLLAEYVTRRDGKVCQLGTLRHKDHSFISATVDALDYKHGVCVEGKCPFKREIVDGAIPSKYLPQLAVQHAVVGVPPVYAEYAVIAGVVRWNALTPDVDGLVSLFEQMLPILRSFRELVLQYHLDGVLPDNKALEVLADPTTNKKRSTKFNAVVQAAVGREATPRETCSDSAGGAVSGKKRKGTCDSDIVTADVT
jgi:hypothetical protein